MSTENKECILILTEAPMIPRVERWASMNSLKVAGIPVMKVGVPLALEVIDDSCAELTYNLADKTVRSGGRVIGYWTYEPVVSAREGRTVKLIQPIGY